MSEERPWWTPLRNWLFTPELQWQPRGYTANLTGVRTGNARGSVDCIEELGSILAEHGLVMFEPKKTVGGSSADISQF